MSVEAQLRWLKPEQGGRASPLAGPTFITIIRFDDQAVDLKEEAWSVVVDFIESPNADLVQRVRMRFLMEDAPQEQLMPGVGFELMEGPSPMARRTVLG